MRLKGVNMLDKFVVLLEWTDAWSDLTDEEMGILFKKFISHAKGEDIKIENRIVNQSWLSKVNDIDRMTAKYIKDIENGKTGGAPKGNKNASKQPKNNPETTQEQPLNNPETTNEIPLKNNPETTPKQPINININKNKNKSKNIIDNEVAVSRAIKKLSNEDKSTINYIMDISGVSYEEAVSLYLKQDEVIFSKYDR